MLADLQRLAGRKLIEARHRAVVKIDQWEAALALIERLGKEAELEFQLPSQLIDCSKSRSGLEYADYLGTLKISELADDAFVSTRTAASEQLKSTLNQRASTVSTIKNDITQLSGKRDGDCAAAKTARQNMIYAAQSLQNATILNSGSKFGMGCLGSILGFFTFVLLAAWDAFPDYAKRNFSPMLVFYLFALIGFLALPTIFCLIGKIRLRFEAALMKSNAEAIASKAIREVETVFGRDVAPAQAALAKAETKLQKAVQTAKKLELGR